MRPGNIGGWKSEQEQYRKVMVMMKSKLIWILVGIGVFSFGCDLMTSQEDIKRAIYTVMRGYETSTKNIRPQIMNQYANAADLKFISKDETIINEMHVLIREDNTIVVSGECLFSGYEDPYSGYSVEGGLAYDCEKDDTDYGSCEFSCNAKLHGGKIKQLDFLLELDSEGTLAVGSVSANGKKVRFHQWDYVTRIIRAFNPRTNL